MPLADHMWEFFTLLTAASLVNNLVLSQFLGLCPFVGVSSRWASAVPMGLATLFVMTFATLITHTLYQYALVPLEVEYLKIVVFITAIAAVVQLTEIYIRTASPLLFQLLGIYLPLITSNCAVLGIALIVMDLSLWQALAISIGGAVGFTIAIILFADLREQIAQQNVPRFLRGVPIALVTVGIMALAFSGFRGITE